MTNNQTDLRELDPPDNLSDSGKRDRYCLCQIVAQILLPNDHERDAKSFKRGDFATPSFSTTDLGRIDRAIREGTRVGVPEGAVNFKHPSVSESEIDTGDEAAPFTADRHLSKVVDAESIQFGGDYILKLADGFDAPFCNGTCSCFTEPRTGVIGVAVVVSSAASSDCAPIPFGVVRSDANVWFVDNTRSQTEGAATVVAGTRAVHSAVLRLDLRGGTGELDITHGALKGLPVFQLTSAQPVGTGTRTGALSPMANPHAVSVVGDSANRTFTLNHVPHMSHAT